MMKYLFASLILLGLCACTPPQFVDRVIYGGTIHTGLAGDQQVEAVAIKDGRIVWSGDASKLSHYNAPVRTDLKGAHAFPGFTDAHAHLFGIGAREVTLNLEGINSLAELLDALKAEAVKQPKGTIIGRGWIETHWPEKRFPNRFDLESAAPGRVVLLERADGHALVASSAALEVAGIDGDTKDPKGGRLERDGEGAPSGILVDYAMMLVADLVTEPQGEARRSIMARGVEVMNAYGWTGTHNMSVPLQDVLLLEDMANKGELNMRVYNGIDLAAREILANGHRFAGDNRVITRAIKIYMDGALGSRGAALLAPYADQPEHSGLMLTSRDQTMPLLLEALREGWQIEMHAIGDRGNHELLNWMRDAMQQVPVHERKIAEPRWRSEHAQIISPDDIARFAKLGVIPSMQPSHAIGDLYFARDRLGHERLAGGYAWQSLIQAGSIIPGGSDAPVERGDPRIEFYAAIHRHGLDGYQDESWYAKEAVTREQALAMFTLWPAIASFQEDELGTIEVGKRADFSVFDRDLMQVPPRQILEAKTVITIVDGRDVFTAKE